MKTRDSRRKTLLVVSQLPPPVHGSTVMTAHFLDAMRDLDMRVLFVDRRFSRSAAEVGRASLGKLLSVPSLAARVLAAAARRPAAAVFYITNRPGSFLVDALLVELLRRAGVPLILYVHTVGFRALAARGSGWRRVVERTLRTATRIVVLGAPLVADISALAPRADIRLMPNTAGAVPALGPRSRRSQGDPVDVLFLSNLLPEKGADTFVAVAADLVERAPHVEWRFRIAGDNAPARLAEVQREIARRGLSDKSEVVVVDGADHKWALMRAASLLVFPSRYPYEAQPLTIIEALSVGVPVVAFDIGGLREVVDDGVGALVPAGDRAAMTEAVLGLERDGTLRGSREKEIRTRYAERYSMEAFRAGWRDLLDGSQHEE